MSSYSSYSTRGERRLSPDVDDVGQKPAILAVAFLLILADALVFYFLIVHYQRLPVLAIVPLFALVYLLVSRDARSSIPPVLVLLLVSGFLGYSLGILTIEDFSVRTFLQIGGAYASWLVGYWMFLNRRTTGNLLILVLLLTSVHVGVCLVALNDINPALFPTFDLIWAHEGDLIRRPSVTTDQNFQVFYFLPLLGILFAARSQWVVAAAFLMSLLAMVVLGMVQTRSGILAFVGTFFCGWLIALFGKNGNRMGGIVLAAAGAIGALIVISFKYDALKNLFIRFTGTDYDTGFGRWHSFVYFFEKIGNPIWWIPQGNSEFIAQTGNVPHSNITAQFLEGGLLALITWIALVVVPTWAIYFRAFKDSSDSATVFVAIVAMGMLVVQLSVNVPLSDQVWLWGGAAYGIYASAYKIGEDTL